MAFLMKSAMLNRLCFTTLNQTQLAKQLTTSSITIKLDGKPINIEDLPKKPKPVNLFDQYCKDNGIGGAELKNQREQLVRSFKENKESYEAKNKRLIDNYKSELKAYRETFKKSIKLRDVSDLINFYNRQAQKIAQKEATRKQRKPAFYAFFVKQAFKEGSTKDLHDAAQKYKNLSSSELDHYKRLYENYLKEI